MRFSYSVIFTDIGTPLALDLHHEIISKLDILEILENSLSYSTLLKSESVSFVLR